MVKALAILVGLVFVALGVIGLIPGAAPAELLFHSFHVSIIHNIAHIVIGIIFISTGLAGTGASRLSFRVFGIIYGILGIWGLVVAPRHILWIVFNSGPEVWSRIVLAAIFLFLGFATSRNTTHA